MPWKKLILINLLYNTNTCSEYEQKNPTIAVDIAPKTMPAFEKAIGIVKTPLPSELLSK